jgi:hypothetical protein
MQRTLTSLIQVAACLTLMLGVSARAADDKKADPTGTWTWTTPGRNGGQGRQTTLKLKMDGGKLTGTVSGGQNETAIADAKITGDEISFKVTRERGGNSFTQKFAGKISGDTIKGKIEFQGRDNQSQSRDWEAKREAAKAK